MKRWTAILLAAVILTTCCACSTGASSAPSASDSNTGAEQVSLTRPLQSEQQQAANASTASAVRRYVEARIKTDAFVAADFQSMTDEEILLMVDELAGLWKTALDEATSAQSSAAELKSAIGGFGTGAQHLRATSSGGSYASLLENAAGAEFDPQTWAENLTKQYDAICGANTVKQLAAQLGVDAKSAYEQLTLAQDIIRSGATRDADYYDKLTKIAQVTKTVCKVGLFVTATVATGGGTLTALVASSATLGQAGAVIVGGTDCIVDVASTGSTIILGEDNQVTVAFNEALKDKLAPISAVVGLLTFNASSTGEQIAYIGDTLTGWFYEGKVLGIKVAGGPDGTSVQARPIDVAGASADTVDAALEESGFTPPSGETAAITPAPAAAGTVPAPSASNPAASQSPPPAEGAPADGAALTADELSGAYLVSLNAGELGNQSYTGDLAVTGNTAILTVDGDSQTYSVSGNTISAHLDTPCEQSGDVLTLGMRGDIVITFSRQNGVVVGTGGFSGVLIGADGSETEIELPYVFTKME